ncbi:pseudouridine synthase [Pararobbsia silviterrae]|uniref:Dual-specificity RNA pseudouridine synthase RluF n=1 Tax=Pararobbsia silviterrae TaxID=1792498 RepID=A0A494XVP7_9BURK|nr:pseudouridine synthase [Pararobbsia silviterrae]RKP54648.1 pseudouridine synthase [Pararobbsia silviterrae]
MREKLTAKHPRTSDARRAPVRPGAPRKPLATPERAGGGPRTRSADAAPGSRKPRTDSDAPRRPRADGDAPRKPRFDADAPRRPRADGDAPRKPRFDADAPRRPRADGDAPRKPRFDADAPRRPRADGDAPRKPRFDADAPRRPRADGDAPRKPRFDADAPRRPRTDGDAPRKPRFDADAPRRPRADGDAPRKPRFDADAPRRPRADGDAPRKPRFDADAPRRPRADGDAPRKPRFDADAPRRPRADGDAPRKPRFDADAPRRPRADGDAPRKPRFDTDAPRRPRADGDAPRRPRLEGETPRRVVTNTAGAPRRSHVPSPRGDASHGAPSPRARTTAPADRDADRDAATDFGEETGMLRLSKRMSELGLCSRREADEWIEKGWVLVDGKRVDTLGTKVRPDQQIEILPAARQQQADQVTILIHKPVGYVSGQPEDDYLPAAALITAETQWADDASGTRFRASHLRSLAPAGRLDIDSTGLLVMTQDGRVARQLIGADSEVDKEYLVRVTYNGLDRDVQSAFPAERLALLCHGLSLDDQPLRPAEVEWQNPEQLRFVLREGKKRQIRRMCELVGLEVVGLKRVRIGKVMLGALPAGQWRYLRADESFGDIA